MKMIKGRRVLIVALGSGGDIISSCQLKWALEENDNTCFLSFFDFRGISFEIVSSTKVLPVTLKNKNTVRYFAPYVGSTLGLNVFAIDARILNSDLLSSINDFISRHNIDLVVGVDGGGDVFARFDTKILNVLPDAFGLKILSGLSIESFIAVLAPTADRELTREQWETVLSQSYQRNGFVTILDQNIEFRDKYREIQDVSAQAGPSYVNKVVGLAADGFFGVYTTPYGFSMDVNPYQRFIYIFTISFVLHMNEFIDCLTKDTYEKNLYSLATSLQNQKLLSGDLKTIMRRLDD